jgi:hypothetical protein
MEQIKCDYYLGCVYNKDGYCSYNESKIQVEISKACYDDFDYDDED